MHVISNYKNNIKNNNVKKKYLADCHMSDGVRLKINLTEQMSKAHTPSKKKKLFDDFESVKIAANRNPRWPPAGIQDGRHVPAKVNKMAGGRRVSKFKQLQQIKILINYLKDDIGSINPNEPYFPKSVGIVAYVWSSEKNIHHRYRSVYHCKFSARKDSINQEWHTKSTPRL